MDANDKDWSADFPPPTWRSPDGAALLYLGDCLELLPKFPPGSIDAVVTDPPYGIVNQFADQDRTSFGRGTRKCSFEWDHAEGVGQAVGQAVGLLHKPGAAFVFCGLDTVPMIQAAYRAAGLTPKAFAWFKPNPPPPMPGNWWPSGFELAIYGYQQGAWFGDADPRRSNRVMVDNCRHMHPEKNGHPTQKPLGVMLPIAGALCPPSGIILDCYMGSATTGVAAMRLGRRFVGIEICEKYFTIARKRIDAESRQGNLFKPELPAQSESPLLPGV